MNGFFFTPVPPPEPQPRKAAEDGQRRCQPQAAGQSWNLHLESADTDVDARFLNVSPSVAMIAVEDLCWQAATEDWRRRRPPWWRTRARAVWHAEGAQLAAKADRLRDLAGQVCQEL
jgi:hypothetical protein